HVYRNGLTLLCEKIPGMQSAAMTLLLPAGAATDPVDRSGSAAVLSDLLLRGAGNRDSRQLTDYLDGLGLQRSSSVGVYHLRFACAGVGPRVVESIAAYGDIVRRPHLPESGFRAARDLALQALCGIEDEPRHKLLVRLRQWFLPSPLGRNPMGDKSQVEKLTLETCRQDYRRRFHAHGAILAIAGNIDFARVRDEVDRYFSDFSAGKAQQIRLVPPPGNYHFERSRSEQTHIGMAWPSVAQTHKDYFAARVAAEILGGGTSGRLFTEVREKRGLCYSVGAGYGAVKDEGNVMAYAGTSNDRAQQTLDCLMSEIRRFDQGVSDDEVSRAKVGLAANTIMQEESTSSRAASLAHDYFFHGRLRTLAEIKRQIAAVTAKRVNRYLKAHPAGPFTIVIVGPKELRPQC
ncbi:MAG TPA: pitrilysin family protein, partial [Tepidisphaeraceae bacterium]|nr:pitrilysin family protein [Tepidisphaeraceae bacterium]